ncbi:hypothetical protein [Streptomyces hoynatensis]|nr:hypothetical protein [Streptomyces hoynatensis]
MTTAPEMDDSNTPEDESMWAGEAPTYPEAPDNPHNHVYTWSPKLPDGSMLVIRSNTAAGLLSAAAEAAGVIGELISTWSKATGTAAAVPAPEFQALAQQFPQAGPFPQASQQPNQSFPNQPAWQTTGSAPGQFPQQAPQQQGGNRDPKPRPNWPQVYKLSVGDKNAFRQFRNDNKQFTAGKIYWAGGPEFWIHPDIAQMVNGFGPVVPA